MQNIVDKLKGERNRSSTKANYYGIWKNFNEFFIRLDAKPSTWEERLVLFVGFLINQKKKSTTIRSYVSAIKAVLRDDGEEINEDTFLIKSLTRACKLVNDRVCNKLPIRRGLLSLILKELEKLYGERSQDYLHTLYSAIFSTAYFGFFRIGEVACSQHVIKAKDVHIGKNKKKMMFVLHTSKTHGLDAKPQIVKISSSDLNANHQMKNIDTFCPFEILEKFVTSRRLRRREDEQFFIFSDGTPVQPSHCRTLLKDILSKIGLQNSLYGFHSLRGGRAVDMLSMKISVETIKTLGRWKSGAVYTYLKNS